MPGRRNLRSYYVRCLAHEIGNAASCIESVRTTISEQVGLNAERWRALAVIGDSPHVLSISGLARQLRLARQSVHRLAADMERDGLVRFLPNSDDRRLLQLELTSSGRSLLADAEQRFSMWLLVMSAGLGTSDLCKMIYAVRNVREVVAKSRDYV